MQARLSFDCMSQVDRIILLWLYFFYIGVQMAEQLTSNNELEAKAKDASVTLVKLRNILVNSVREYQNTQNKWFSITDPVAINLIMNTYGDTLNRQILASVASRPNTVMGIVTQCDIPQTTGYSKIMGLIENEFLIRYDTLQKNKTRHIHRYLSTFRELQVNISENQGIVIKAKIAEFVQNQARV